MVPDFHPSQVNDRSAQWVVCQIGAREHFGIARALSERGGLAGMVTDVWVPPRSGLARFPGCARLADRYHPALAELPVVSFNRQMLGLELRQRATRQSGWSAILERNALFQKLAIKEIRRLDSRAASGDKPTLFSYSYAALELFREAKKLGWSTVLGQIDPGPEENALVERLRAENPDWAGASVESSPPDSYWETWREECSLADRIIVNSTWSKSLVEKAGIHKAKIEIVPLAYDCPDASAGDSAAKTVLRGKDEVLRVLYLGQAIVRKGIHDLASAAVRLDGAPIRIDVVGGHGVLPPNIPANLVFHGSVPRSEASAWYRQAEVFVLPTHSDGFALTQLEAMAHSVPVIATPACGEVVIDGHNGCLVPPGDPETLAKAISWMLEHPEQREMMGLAARETAGEFGLDRVADALVNEN